MCINKYVLRSRNTYTQNWRWDGFPMKILLFHRLMESAFFIVHLCVFVYYINTFCKIYTCMRVYTYTIHTMNPKGVYNNINNGNKRYQYLFGK